MVKHKVLLDKWCSRSWTLLLVMGSWSEQLSSRQVCDQCSQQATANTGVVILTTGWTSGVTNIVENDVIALCLVIHV